MAGKKGTTRKSPSKKATKKTTKRKIEKIEKKQGNQSDGRKNNGGAREGAGRKPLEERERLNTLKDQAELHALEEVEVAIVEGGVTKAVKMQRAHALLDVLFSEGLKRKNISAIKEYFDRTRGKARQEVDLSGEIQTQDQYTPTDPALRAASEAYKEALKQQIINGEHE
jgi:hypothetical protein